MSAAAMGRRVALGKDLRVIEAKKAAKVAAAKSGKKKPPPA